MEKQVCRDFLRNVCHRDRCKYKHPSVDELEQTVKINDEDTVYEFCHDFQNDQCQRQNCRFIHCSPKEEEEYHSTKKLPLRLKYQYDYGISDYFLGQDTKMSLEQSIRILEEAGKPVCRNYLNFECNRGQNCKYIHLDIKKAAELAAEMDIGAAVKRPRMMDLDENNGYRNSNEQPLYNMNMGIQNRLSQQPPEHLEEENVTLRKRIQELEKQVSDLAATNEVLLEQNAQFRLHKRGITNYGHSKAMTSSYSPAGMTTHANLQGNPVVNNNQQPVPVQLNMQVTGQPQEVRNSLVQPPQRTMVQPEQRMLQQVPASVSRTNEIAAQVLAANIAANSGGTVETIPVQNQIVSALAGPIQQTNAMIQQPALNQMNQQPIASYSASIPSHNQLVHQSMAPYSGAMPTHNQMGQQPVSFANTIMAAALAGGRNVIPNGANIAVTIAGDVRQPPVGSMGQQVIHQPALVYTVTRSTDNMQLANTIVPATGHELALVADAQQRNTASLHGGQGYHNVSSATQAIVQSRQPSDIVQAAPMTSGIGAAITSMPPAVSRGAVHPGVQQNNLVQAPRVNNVSCSVVNGGGQLNEQTLITFPISAVPQQQMHN